MLDADLLKPVADEVAKNAEVLLIGYAGGGTRNIFVNKPVRNLAEMKGLKVRVQGAPIWSRTFSAIGMSPTVIAYNEVYNAIQNNVIAAGENEAAGVEAMKFFEVAPHLSMTQHAITIRPICFSGKTFAKLPKDLQDAILKAGKEAGAYGRKIESDEDTAKLDALEKAGKLKRVPFTDRAEMKKLADPVMEAYAKEIGADGDLRQDQCDQVKETRRPTKGLRRRLTRAPPLFDVRLMNLLRTVNRAYDRLLSWLLVFSVVIIDLPGQPADLLALHRADPALHLDRGDGALPVRLDDHDRRDDRRAREHALRGRRLAAPVAARRAAALRIVASLFVLGVRAGVRLGRLPVHALRLEPHLGTGRTAAVDDPHRLAGHRR